MSVNSNKLSNLLEYAIIIGCIEWCVADLKTVSVLFNEFQFAENYVEIAEMAEML